MRHWLILAISGLISVSAFAPTREQLDAIARFQVVNSQGESAPPVPAERLNGQWPYGVLVHVSQGKVDEFATVTHFGNGTVLGAAHSFMNDPNPNNYAIVFFDSSGSKKVVGVEAVPFSTGVNNAPTEDMAVIHTRPEDVSNWHSLNAKPFLFDYAEHHAPMPVPREYSVWVADPMITRKDVMQKMGIISIDDAQGAVLGKRTAIGSRTQPVSARDFYQRGGQGTPPLYLDSFEPSSRGPIRKGNSGGVITISDPHGRPQVVGVISTVVPGKPGTYFGNTGTQTNDRPSIIYSAGCVLHDLVEKRLDFRNIHDTCAVIFDHLASGGCR